MLNTITFDQKRIISELKNPTSFGEMGFIFTLQLIWKIYTKP